MAMDICIQGTELKWKNSSGTIFSREGASEGTEPSAVERSIWIEGNSLYYIDDAGSHTKRRIDGNNIGTISNSFKARSIRINGDNLEYLVPDANPSNDHIHYEVAEGSPPTESVSNLNINAPATVFTYPYDAEATWSNNNTTDGINVRWYRNGNLVQSISLGSGNTSHTSNDTYWNSGDEIQVQVAYFNQFGEGPITSEFQTA